MPDYFNWLHLSDLHFGEKDQRVLWPNLREAFFSDLEALHDRCGPWHAVFFTGDLVYSGRPAQFEQFEAEVLERLFARLKSLGSGEAVLLAVPGNHDIDRPDTSAKIPANLRQLLRRDGFDEIAEEFWASVDSEYHQVISKSLASYSSWWEKTPWRKGALIQPGRLPGDFATTIKVGARQIGIAGLNTTFLQLAAGDYQKRLVWHPEQLRAVCGDPVDWTKIHDSCLLLTHQGVEWLTDEARTNASREISPAGRFAVHMFGHMHENNLSGVSRAGGTQRMLWQTASLFGIEKFGESQLQKIRRHGYSCGRLEFRDPSVTVRCWPRTASCDDNGWRLHADHVSSLLEADEGTKQTTVRETGKHPKKGKRNARQLSPAGEATERTLIRVYLQAARSSWDIVDLAGLPEDDRHIAMQKFMLRQLFMPLRMLVEKSSGPDADSSIETRREKQRLANAGRTDSFDDNKDARVSLGAWLTESLSKTDKPRGPSAPRLVILGDPGGGKSTLLRWLASACLLKAENNADFALLPDASTLPQNDWIPIIVRCRELDKDCVHNTSLDELLRQTLPKLELAKQHIDALVTILRLRLESGKALLLVDGLDEINDPNQRIAFCDRIEAIARYFSRSPVIATSRIVGYREMRRRIGGGFVHATLEDLLPEEKDAFVKRWCEVTITDPQRRVSEIAALQKGIHGNDRVARLTGNPMLLTTMALVQRKVGKLPPRRHRLYWEAVELLLRWRASPDEPPLDSDEALPQLEYLAYSMCDRGVQRLRRDEVIELLAQMRSSYPEIRPVHRQSPDEFLKILERRTGLLTETGSIQHDGQMMPVYEFRHLTFQEYLAALALVRGHFPGHVPGSTLAARIAPLAGKLESTAERDHSGELVVTENWRETLRLAVSSSNDDDVSLVLTAILTPSNEKEIRPRAILAAQCLADEPNVQISQAELIIGAFCSQIRENEGGSPFASSALESAAFELAAGDWKKTLVTFISREFLKREAPLRGSPGGLAAMIMANGTRPENRDDQGWLINAVEDLESDSDEATAAAALQIMHHSWEFCTQVTRTSLTVKIVPGLIDRLTKLLQRSAALAHAGAWALGWLASKHDNQIWRPTDKEFIPLNEYLAGPNHDSEALRWIAIIVQHNRKPQALAHLISLKNSEGIDLRRSVIRAIALIADPIAARDLVPLLKDADSDIRKAALRGLLEIRDETDRKLLPGQPNQTYSWHDPSDPFTLREITDASRRLRLSTGAVRQRFEQIAREYSLSVESPRKVRGATKRPKGKR